MKIKIKCLSQTKKNFQIPKIELNMCKLNIELNFLICNQADQLTCLDLMLI